MHKFYDILDLKRFAIAKMTFKVTEGYQCWLYLIRVRRTVLHLITLRILTTLKQGIKTKITNIAGVLLFSFAVTF